jgi:hypothetical protein
MEQTLTCKKSGNGAHDMMSLAPAPIGNPFAHGVLNPNDPAMNI